MRILALGLVGILATCGGNQPQPATPPPAAPVSNTAVAPPPDAAPAPGSTQAAIAKMHEFKDTMCACKDTACAQHVSDDMMKWAKDQAGKYTDAPKMTDDQLKDMTAVGEAMGHCMQTAMGASPSP